MKHGIFDWIKSIFRGPQEYLILREYSIFSELNSYDLFLLYELVHTREFKPGELIFESGYPLEVIYLIHSGEIELRGEHHANTGKVLGQGEHLGILDLYYNGQRNSTATAKSKVTAHAISRTDLQGFIESRPHMGIKILGAINRDLCNLLHSDIKEI